MKHENHSTIALKRYKAHIGFMKIKSWEKPQIMWVYKFCVKDIIMKIVNLAQLWNSLKHEDHQNDLIFKVYVCHVQTKEYIHIQT